MRIPVQTLWTAVTTRFDGIVSVRVAEAGERRRHAGLMAVLVSGALAAALAIPLAGMSGGTAPVVAASALSSLCLVLAAGLAATAAFDAVLAAAVAGVALLLAFAAVLDGGAASPLVLLLAIAPVEALRSARRQLFWACFGIASLGICFVFAATSAGFALEAGGFGVSAAATAAVLSGYAAVQAARFRRRLAAQRSVKASAPTAGAAGHHLMRFAADGALWESSPEAARRFGDRMEDDRLPFALSLVHVADRVRYLAAFGEIRAGASAADCDARLWDAERAAFADTSIRLSAVRDGAELSGILFAADFGAGEDAAAEDLEEALKTARAESEAKSNFLAMVSHELRTPLNAIIGFSDVLDRELFGSFPDARQKEYVGLIRQSGEHLLSVVNGLLDISKIEAGRYELVTERFDIGEVLETAAATIRAEAERKGLRFDVRNECTAGILVADRRAVQQILLNLIANAVKFTDAGRVEISARETGGLMRITVSDTGIGIAADDLPRLGQPFTQASTGLTRRYPGTGLGLSLVKGFAELHRGSLRIASEPGLGTIVEVTLSLDCGLAVDHNEPAPKVVSLKHVRTPEAPVPSFEARRSA